MTQQVPEISVVIPSYNHCKELLICLRSIYEQETKFSFEIIVADSSFENIQNTIRSEFPQVNVVHRDQQMLPGTARNAGVKKAKAEILAFTDSDCTVDKDWLNQIMRAQNSGHNVICGAIRNGYPGNLIATAEYFMECGEYIPERKSQFVDMFPAGNLSIKKTLFETAGGFPNSIAAEDDLLSFNLKQHGNSIYFDNSIAITHFQRTKLKNLWQKQKNLGIGFYKSRKVYPLLGHQLVKSRLFAFPIPLLRMFTIWRKVLRGGIKYLPKLFLTSPFIFFGLLAFTVGFWQAFDDVADGD